MSSGTSSRSGAKPSAGPPAPPTPLRPSTNGSSMMPRNWLVESGTRPAGRRSRLRRRAGVSALPRLPPVSPNTLTKLGGSAPPLLKKLLSALATLRWLTLRPRCRARSARGLPSVAVRFRITSLRCSSRLAVKPAGRLLVVKRVERGAVEPARGREDGVGARHVAARGERRLHGAGERGAAAGDHIGARRGRRIDLHEIERARLEREIARDRHALPGVPWAGREGAAAVDRGRAHRADAGELPPVFTVTAELAIEPFTTSVPALIAQGVTPAWC